ncbi:MAG TPA: hypothetical protein VER39_13900 [Nocardioidaceae bacterium]|nr:hypothetical protein [Nocardioidaceae bacterium]
MLLPESVLLSGPVVVLAAFVAVNTVMYGALAIGKLLPKVYLSDWIAPRNKRSESRSIYPAPDAAPLRGPGGPVRRDDQQHAPVDDGDPDLLDSVP